MNKGNMVHMHNGVVLWHKEKWNYFICTKMEELDIMVLSYYNPSSEKLIVHSFLYVEVRLLLQVVLPKNNNNNDTH
jgi:hypothetical protein